MITRWPDADSLRSSLVTQSTISRPATRHVSLMLLLSLTAAACFSASSTSEQLSTPTGSPEVPLSAQSKTELGSGNTKTGVEDREPPNIIVFMTDDMGEVHMPAMVEVTERIEKSGLRFVNSIVGYPTCCPSRATFLTGQHALNHRVLWNTGPTGGFSAFTNQEATIATAMQGGGYDTIFVGKYLNGFGWDDQHRYVPPGWSDFHALVDPAATLYYEYSIFHNGQIMHYGEAEDDYVTDRLTETALMGIQEQQESGAPFFLWLSYSAPHPADGVPIPEFEADGSSLGRSLRDGSKPPVPAVRHIGAAAELALPDDPARFEDDVSDKPEALQRRPLTVADRQRIDSRYQVELESLMAVDESIASILDELDRQGRLENTYVIFTSDNGQFHGQHGFEFGKYFPYEPAARVPLLISGPGIEPGSTADSLVGNVDLAPTIADLASVSLGREADGRSLRPILEDPTHRWRRAMLLEGYAPTRPQRPKFNGVRSDDWSFVQYANGSQELYNLVDDPFQLYNLADDPDSTDIVTLHLQWLGELIRCNGDPCSKVGE